MKKTRKPSKKSLAPTKVPDKFVPQYPEDPDDSNGDFIAFIPSEIEAGDNYGPQLVGLPFNILFGGIRNDAQAEQQSLVSVCYLPAPETFQEDSLRKEMSYFTSPEQLFCPGHLRGEDGPVADREVQGQETRPKRVRFDIKRGDDSHYNAWPGTRRGLRSSKVGGQRDLGHPVD